MIGRCHYSSVSVSIGYSDAFLLPHKNVVDLVSMAVPLLPLGVSGEVQVVMCVDLCLKNVFTSFRLLILGEFNR